MQLNFDISRSLAASPPDSLYGKKEGVNFIGREIGKLSELIVTDDKGISYQPREKSLEDGQRTLENSFQAYGVLYDREPMVVELRKDGQLELISGFGRRETLMRMGVDTYFYDKITFESPLVKETQKVALNASKDHVAKGTPNTEGTYLKYLTKLKENKSFNWRDDKECKRQLSAASEGSLTTKQINAILKKWRKSNAKSTSVLALDKTDANKIASGLGQPTSGFVKDVSSTAYKQVGFVYKSGRLKKEVISWVEKFDEYGKKLKLTFYVEHTELDEKIIERQREAIMEQFENTLNNVLRKYFDKKYHDIIESVSFIAQIKSPDPNNEGKPKEEGLVEIRTKF